MTKQCIHQEAAMIGFVEKAMLRDGVHYTNFYLLKCTKCGKYIGFPLNNFNSAVKDGWKIPSPEQLVALRKPDLKEWFKLK